MPLIWFKFVFLLFGFIFPGSASFSFSWSIIQLLQIQVLNINVKKPYTEQSINARHKHHHGTIEQVPKVDWLQWTFAQFLRSKTIVILAKRKCYMVGFSRLQILCTWFLKDFRWNHLFRLCWITNRVRDLETRLCGSFGLQVQIFLCDMLCVWHCVSQTHETLRKFKIGGRSSKISCLISCLFYSGTNVFSYILPCTMGHRPSHNSSTTQMMLIILLELLRTYSLSLMPFWCYSLAVILHVVPAWKGMTVHLIISCPTIPVIIMSQKVFAAEVMIVCFHTRYLQIIMKCCLF